MVSLWRFSAILMLAAALLHNPLLQASNEAVPRANVSRDAYFGDVHVHTMYSFDAFMRGLRASPDDAYRYAKGEVLEHPAGMPVRLSGPPLDFLAVSEHAKFLGIHAALFDPTSPTFAHPKRSLLIPREGEPYFEAQRRFFDLLEEHEELSAPAVASSAWQRIVEAAERHYRPGEFTTFIAYEYTPTPDGRHLHRNVIFRGSEVPPLPFSSEDSMNPADLWQWLDDQRARGMEAMAIPHNSNQSDGLAFPDTTWRGEAIDRAFAEQRMRNEPLVEITQQKGTSETHPSLSPNDEWAGFEIVRYYRNRLENKDPVTVFEGSYVRDALRTGLEMEDGNGFNPYRMGFVGSSDSHVAAASYEEEHYFTSGPNTPRSRGSVYPAAKGSWENHRTPRNASHGPGGLTGVWAESNTRDAIYDAMRRRETFATSGPRIRLRFFGGYDLAESLAKADDLVGAAYASGVAMGGELPPSVGEAPSFLIWALRAPDSGWLQRAQVVKGWVEDGRASERVYDVACSDGLEPDPANHRCPDNGARVDLSDCSIARDRGAVTLRTVWSDPDFHPDQPAFYYVRVLENPSCRWSTWDALRHGIEPNPALPATIQERAWSSPIWYRPGIDTAAAGGTSRAAHR